MRAAEATDDHSARAASPPPRRQLASVATRPRVARQTSQMPPQPPQLRLSAQHTATGTSSITSVLPHGISPVPYTHHVEQPTAVGRGGEREVPQQQQHECKYRQRHHRGAVLHRQQLSQWYIHYWVPLELRTQHQCRAAIHLNPSPSLCQKDGCTSFSGSLEKQLYR